MPHVPDRFPCLLERLPLENWKQRGILTGYSKAVCEQGPKPPHRSQELLLQTLPRAATPSSASAYWAVLTVPSVEPKINPVLV